MGLPRFFIKKRVNHWSTHPPRNSVLLAVRQPRIAAHMLDVKHFPAIPFGSFTPTVRGCPPDETSCNPRKTHGRERKVDDAAESLPKFFYSLH
jgi:hypothetical protein